MVGFDIRPNIRLHFTPPTAIDQLIFKLWVEQLFSARTVAPTLPESKGPVAMEEKLRHGWLRDPTSRQCFNRWILGTGTYLKDSFAALSLLLSYSHRDRGITFEKI